MIHLALALALASQLPAASSEPQAAALVAGLEELEAPLAAGQWDRARELAEALIATHRGRSYGLLYLPRLEDALLRLEFGAVFQEHEFEQLMSGELVDYKRGTGAIALRYTAETMEDFVELDTGERPLIVHPAVFSGPFKVRVRGPRYPSITNSASMPLLFAGLGDEDYLVAMFGIADQGGSTRYYAPATLTAYTVGGESELVDEREESPLERYGPFDLRFEVSSSSVTAYAGKKKLVTGRVGEAALGRVGFMSFPEFDEFELKGRIEPSWLQGLLDSDRERQRARFEEGYDLDAALEGWLPLPDVASFGFGEESSKGTPKPAKDVRHALARARLGYRTEALELFQTALDEDPHRADVWFERVDLLLSMGRRSEALDSLHGALAWEAFSQELHEINGLFLRAKRGPGWPETFEVRTDHYIVRSDIGQRVCVDAARVLESSYERFSHRLGEVDAEGELFPVYLFAGEAGYHRYARGVLGGAPENTAGVFSPQLGQLLIWNVPERTDMMQTIRHEGFHQYFDLRVGDAPRWLNEGLAEYYENADFTKGRSRQIQSHPEHLLTFGARQGKLQPLAEFVFQGPGEFYADPSASYGQAWLLVHYLQHSGRSERELFDRLIEELASGDDASQAVKTAFEGADFVVLDRGLAKHLDEFTE